jgi:hypothetical protein
MQFSAVVAVAALAGAAQAWYPSNSSVVYVTDVYTSYTTYCPEATTLTYNSVTYTITEVCTQNQASRDLTAISPYIAVENWLVHLPRS